METPVDLIKLDEEIKEEIENGIAIVKGQEKELLMKEELDKKEEIEEFEWVIVAQKNEPSPYSTKVRYMSSPQYVWQLQKIS